jgi:hypothetical protein
LISPFSFIGRRGPLVVVNVVGSGNGNGSLQGIGNGRGNGVGNRLSSGILGLGGRRPLLSGLLG